MILTLPFAADVPHYSMQLSLDGTTYVFELRFNPRDGGWFFSVATPEGEPLVSGVRLSTSVPLLRRFVDRRLPQGVLFAVDTAGAGADAGESDLGSRIVVLYSEAGA